MNLEQTGAVFETTDWPLIEVLRNGSGRERDAASEKLIRRYWPPVYGWLRRSGCSTERAAETTQAFFTEVILNRRLMNAATESKGTLRAFVLTALKRFLIDGHRHAARRPVMITPGALDWEDSWLETTEAPKDDTFDRRWALATLESAVGACKAHYLERKRPDYWRAFELRVLRPCLYGTQPAPLQDVASELGFRDAAHAAVAVHTVKVKCHACLITAIAEGAGSPEARYEDLALVEDVLK